MGNCGSAPTPMVKYEQDETSFPYRKTVGALMYLMVSTRPDIAYAVSIVSRSLENPTINDWCRVKRILRYLEGTKDCGIVYKKHFGSGVLNCYSDSDFGGDYEKRRSTTGLLTLYAGGAISWISQRQPSVQLSTTGTEIVAASEAARGTIWLK
ncbi:uncharacterized protein LOC128982130 [Macrosteles quadrilineatus]|uniref:uncharacterized protein LOC128982130 n=1 Tax=Macrosteles quadrilineatus TaxID=74068 RepID=UPI0023E2C17F|nr:uncharacterized protein LOC128982130 [Macrosteles quadrilineatus]